MDEAQREGWRQVQADYTAALAIARRAWPDGPPEVIQAATATLLIEHGKRAGQGSAPANGGSNGAAPIPPCPACGGAMQRVNKTNPKQPDFRCQDRRCDKAVWLDRKRGR